MSDQDEVITKFKEELRRILDSETQSRKERIAALRQHFHETISGLEDEADSSSALLADRLENQLLATMDPLWTLPELHADLSDKHEKLIMAAQQLEEENTLLRAQNAQVSEQIAAVSRELLQKSELLDHWSQVRQELDQRVAGMEQELEQVKGNALQQLEQAKTDAANQIEQVKANASQELEKTKADAKQELEQAEGNAAQQLEQAKINAAHEIEQIKADAAQQTRETLQRLLASREHIEGKKSQVDILTSFVDEAAQYSARVALFVAKSDMFMGWLSHGFNAESFGDQDIKAVHFSMHDDSALKHAFAYRHLVVASRLSHFENGQIFERLGAPQKDYFVTIPLVVKDKSTAVLYADAGMGAEGTCEAEALELLVELVAISVELLAYQARAVTLQYPGVHVAEKPSSTVQLQQRPLMETGVAAATTPPEYLTPLQTSPPSPEEPVLQEAPIASSLTEEESKLHNDAKRFARLLVSEIKLYNEQKVVDGRRNRDIYDRLKDDIDRSREMYNKRVSAVVIRKVDYFYDELVRTLGENDPGALGLDCPGPTVAGG